MSLIVPTSQPLYSLEPGYRFVKNMCQPNLPYYLLNKPYWACNNYSGNITSTYFHIIDTNNLGSLLDAFGPTILRFAQAEMLDFH